MVLETVYLKSKMVMFLSIWFEENYCCASPLMSSFHICYVIGTIQSEPNEKSTFKAVYMPVSGIYGYYISPFD